MSLTTTNKCRGCGLPVHVDDQKLVMQHEPPQCEWFTQLMTALVQAGTLHELPPVACTCTITRHERMENKSCPVHFPQR